MARNHLRQFLTYFCRDLASCLFVGRSLRFEDTETSVDTLPIPVRRTKCLISGLFFRRYTINVKRVEDYERVCLNFSGNYLSFTVEVHSMVLICRKHQLITACSLFLGRNLVVLSTCDASVNMIAVSYRFGLETCLVGE
jgi:hypothetical protein